MSSTSELNTFAQTLKSLHISGQPLSLVNVFDIPSARTVIPLPRLKAVATASWGIAYTAGIADDDLDLENNLAGVRKIAEIAREHGKPLSVDLQDGYGDKLETAVRSIIEAGAVGINLEDYCKNEGRFYADDEAAGRVGRVMKVAGEMGVPDFVVNARCDILVHGGKLEDVLKRGKKYLEAGATTVFVWAGGREVTVEEMQTLVKEFEGRLAVLRGGSTKEKLAELGVARISVGPTLLRCALEEYRRKANEILGTEN